MGLENKIHLFSKGSNQDSLIRVRNPPSDVNRFLEEDKERFFDAEYMNGWHEALLAGEWPVSELDIEGGIDALVISSHQHQAIKNGKAPPKVLLSVLGLTRLSDGNYVAGLGVHRLTNTLRIAPEATISYQRHGEIILNNCYKESREELGIRQLVNPRVLGYVVSDKFPIFIGYVTHAETDLTFRELNEMHRESRHIYLKTSKNADPVWTRSDLIREVRIAVTKAGLPNIDAWEYAALFSINPLQRSEIVRTGMFVSQDVRYPVAYGARGAFMLLERAA